MLKFVLMSNPCIAAGRQWLHAAQNDDGGWGGATGTPSSIEETALALEALCAGEADIPEPAEVAAICRGLAWLNQQTKRGREFRPTPIGFYFAKLWYYEQLYPVVYTLAATGRARHWFQRAQTLAAATK